MREPERAGAWCSRPFLFCESPGLLDGVFNGFVRGHGEGKFGKAANELIPIEPFRCSAADDNLPEAIIKSSHSEF